MKTQHEPLLDIRNLRVRFHTDTGLVKAVEGLNLSLAKGEALGLVGETGAGKTTSALAVMQLIDTPPGEIAEGEILFEGNNILAMSEEEKEAIGRAREMLALVGIRPERGPDYPHQFSGGMKQRVVIAIALACNPALLIADEPTTALDVTIQAQVLELMRDLKQRFESAMILISHDIGVVAEICDSVAIMYAGRIVEKADAAALYGRPLHPYTQGLFSSIPDLTREMKRLHTIPGLPPDPTNLPEGCCFAPRCRLADDACRAQSPEMREFAPGHFVACFKAGNKIIQDDAGTEAVQP